MGTADYVSPEQTLARPIGERGDIYSLGATLFALITGHPPYKGTTTELLLQHQVADPPWLTKRAEVQAPDALNDVIATMMAKRKSDRYQTAADVIDALGPGLPASPSGNIVQDPLSTTDLRAAGVSVKDAKGSKRKKKSARAKIAKKRAERKKWMLIGGGAGLLLVVLIAAFAFGGKRTATAQSPGAPKDAAAAPNAPALPPGTHVLEVQSANQAWQYSGVDLPSGYVATITASGGWKINSMWGRKVGAAGNTEFTAADGYVKSGAAEGSLLVRVRDKVVAFSRDETINIDTSGRIYFCANDLPTEDGVAAGKNFLGGIPIKAAAGSPTTATSSRPASALRKPRSSHSFTTARRLLPEWPKPSCLSLVLANALP